MDIKPLGVTQQSVPDSQLPSKNIDTSVELSMDEIIFSSLFKNDSEVLRRKRDMLALFDKMPVFKDEYYVFYSIVRDATKIVPNRQFIELYLRQHRATFSRVKEINLARFSLGDIDEYASFTENCINVFEECNYRHVSEEDYDRAVEMKRMEFVNIESIAIMEESAVILTEGVQRGYHVLAGYKDMRTNLNKRFTVVDNVVNKTDNRGFIVYGPDSSVEETVVPKKVGLFGIPTLDNPEVVGGVHQGDMISVLAPSKGGKSNFCVHSLHASVTQLGSNCVYWPAENGWRLAEAQMRARHFNYKYNSNNTDVVHKRIVNFEMIRKGMLTGELKEMESTSWLDFRCNGEYGKFLNIDKPFKLDSYLQTLEDAVNEINAQYVCIDYLGLLTGDDGENSAGIMAKVYKDVLQFLKNKGIGGIFPGQFKQTVVENMATMSEAELENMELRTVAGGSFEAIKTPDLNMVLYGNKQDLDNGELRIYSVPSRIAKPFKSIPIHADLGSSSFYEVPDPHR